LPNDPEDPQPMKETSRDLEGLREISPQLYRCLEKRQKKSRPKVPCEE